MSIMVVKYKCVMIRETGSYPIHIPYLLMIFIDKNVNKVLFLDITNFIGLVFF